LLTEGGDFDKLGRGTVWRGEIENCLHQNHIFCVRPNPNKLLPEFLSYQTSSPYGRKYFLSCSKQTTNLASINASQVKAFPVLRPNLDEQERVIKVLSNLDKELQKVESHILMIERLRKELRNYLIHPAD
jgi:type I restriction enzyme S subunit